jgi:co-chaperonin GroES (HSP10)
LSKLPKPVGFKILCKFPEIEETFGTSGLIKPDTVRNVEELTSVVLKVIDIGPDAYKDEARFPSGPFCKVGDYIVARGFAGTQFKVDGERYALIYDDAVEAVTTYPEGVTR